MKETPLNNTSKKYRKSSIDPFGEAVTEAKRLGQELAFRCLNMLELLLWFRLRNHPIPPLKSRYEIMRTYRETLIQKHRLLTRYVVYGLKRFEHLFEREAFFKSFVMTWNQNKPNSTPLAGPLLRTEKLALRSKGKKSDVLYQKIPRILS